MRESLATIRAAIAGRWLLWCAITLVIPIAYYLLLLIALVVRFGNLPNYYNFYDWPDNVAHIIRSTPSAEDAFFIVLEEWLFETGYFNTEFGHGISEWNLTLMPARMLVVFVLAGLTATNLVLLLRPRACSRARYNAAGAATGVGALLVAFTNVTMFWVVCCSSPTWVVGLVMMGLGVSASFFLEPLGPWISVAGFAALLAGTCVLARFHSGPGGASHSGTFRPAMTLPDGAR